MNIFEELRINIGMDANTFYPMLITLLSVMVPFIVAIVKSIKGKLENNLLDLHCERESDYFYGAVLLLEVFLATVLIVLYVTINAVMRHIWFGYDKWDWVIYITLVLLSILFVSKCVFIRKRLLGEKQFRWFIYLPMFIFSIIFYSVFSGVYNTALGNVLGLLQIVLETLGLWFLRGRYVRFEYSSAIFYLNNGNIIDCKDISQITRKYNSLIIQEENIQMRFKYNDISTVKYYGDPSVKLLRK